MNANSDALPPRILFIDDNPSIHDDFRKILGIEADADDSLNEMEASLFGDDVQESSRRQFRMDSAYQGQEGLALVKKALADDDPYALAFVDVRMPPGWNGVEALEHIWAVCPDLQAVICSAYSDYTWEDMIQRLGDRDGLLILRKPFETVEVLQIAHALTRKWELNRAARLRMNDLDRIVQQRTNELLAANASLRQQFEEKSRIENALRCSEERFSKAFQASPIPMVIKDVCNQRLLDANPAFLKLAGYDLDELLNEGARTQPRIGDCPALTSGGFQKDGRLRNQPATLKRKDESSRKVLLSSEPLTIGSIPCLLMTLQDITEQDELEERLRQARKMEAVGLLAAGIAHEFNNLLTVIQCNASLLQAASSHTPLENAQLDQISEAGNRAAGLTSQLLAFSRKRVLQRRPLNISQIVERMGEMLAKMIGEQRKLEICCPTDLPLAHADEDSVIQVITNLVVNARDAMPDGGVIRIETSQAVLTPRDASLHPDARAGHFITLTVTDAGNGMNTEILRHLFEPFFTTKEVGKGTGLGLCTIHGIVKQHEGWVEVSSRVRQGSCFKIFLPTTQKQPQPSAPPAQPTEPRAPKPGNGQHVLVVEDEPTVRELASTVLRLNGYRVSEAQDGEEALLAFKTAKNPVELLVTDMVMPGNITGATLARTLAENCENLKVVLTSGYSPEIVSQDSPLIPGAVFLPKPYGPNDLLLAVQSVQDMEPDVELPKQDLELAGAGCI